MSLPYQWESSPDGGKDEEGRSSQLTKRNINKAFPLRSIQPCFVLPFSSLFPIFLVNIYPGPQSSWLLLLPPSSSTAAMRCPRLASASGRSTTRPAPIPSTTPSRLVTVSSTAHVVSPRCKSHHVMESSWWDEDKLPLQKKSHRTPHPPARTGVPLHCTPPSIYPPAPHETRHAIP